MSVVVVMWSAVAVMAVIVLVVLGWVEVSLVCFLEDIPSDTDTHCLEKIIPMMLVSCPSLHQG